MEQCLYIENVIFHFFFIENGALTKLLFGRPSLLVNSSLFLLLCDLLYSVGHRFPIFWFVFTQHFPEVPASCSRTVTNVSFVLSTDGWCGQNFSLIFSTFFHTMLNEDTNFFY